MSPRTITRVGSAALAALGVAALPAPARASFPGRNGAIAFASARHGSYDLYAVSPGHPARRLTRTRAVNETSPAWSADGRRLSFARRDFRDPLHPGPFEVWVMGADGSHPRRLGPGTEPAWSPDGRRIVFTGPRQVRVSRPDLWVMRSDGSHRRRLTTNRASDRSADWSPDGRWIAFASDRGRSHDVWRIRSDGSGAVRVTAVGPYDDQPSWAPDGRRIAFARRAAASGFRLWTVHADGSGGAPVGDTPAFGTAWSPDGRRIAFDRASVPGAPTDLFTLALPAGPPRLLTRDPAPDLDPAWQPR